MIDKSEQMTVFVASPCKGGVPRSQSLQNDFRRRKKIFPPFDMDDNIFRIWLYNSNKSFNTEIER